MKAVLQRVRRAFVSIDGESVGEIGEGILLLLGVAETDTEKECDFLAEKAAGLRIFEDGEGKMNRSLLQTGGSMLVVSQFTLLANCRRGRRPSFTEAARPEKAVPLYQRFVEKIGEMGIPVETGRFGADMLVSIENDGPVTILLDTDELMTKGEK